MQYATQNAIFCCFLRIRIRTIDGETKEQNDKTVHEQTENTKSKRKEKHTQKFKRNSKKKLR